MSRFKHKETTVTDDDGNSIRLRALAPGDRDKIPQIAKDDPKRLPYFLVATCAIEPKLSEEEAKAEVPTELMDRACAQIMAWAKPAFEKKAPSPLPTSSAVESPSSLESSPAK